MSIGKRVDKFAIRQDADTRPDCPLVTHDMYHGYPMVTEHTRNPAAHVNNMLLVSVTLYMKISDSWTAVLPRLARILYRSRGRDAFMAVRARTREHKDQ